MVPVPLCGTESESGRPPSAWAKPAWPREPGASVVRAIAPWQALRKRHTGNRKRDCALVGLRLASSKRCLPLSRCPADPWQLRAHCKTHDGDASGSVRACVRVRPVPRKRDEKRTPDPQARLLSGLLPQARPQHQDREGARVTPPTLAHDALGSLRERAGYGGLASRRLGPRSAAAGSVDAPLVDRHLPLLDLHELQALHAVELLRSQGALAGGGRRENWNRDGLAQ